MQSLKLTPVFGNTMGSVFNRRIHPVTLLQYLYYDV